MPGLRRCTGPCWFHRSGRPEAGVAALAPEGIGKLDYGNLVVDGLIGWGGLAARARLADLANPLGISSGPNTRPWEHLPDLAALRRRLG